MFKSLSNSVKNNFFKKKGIEVDAAPSKPRPNPKLNLPTDEELTRDDKEFRKEKSNHKKKKKKRKSLSSEEEDEEFSDCNRGSSVKVINCNQVQIGARAEYNYTIMVPNDSFAGSSWTPQSNQPNTQGESRGSSHGSNINSESTNEKPSSECLAAFRMLKKEVTENNLLDLKMHIGNGWKLMASYLGYSKGQIDQFDQQYSSMDESIFKLLLDWKRVNLSSATVAVLAKALWDSDEKDACEILAAMQI